MLSLYEELYLLALDEESGTIIPVAKKTISHGLAGAVLAELSFSGKVASNEKHRLELRDAEPAEEGILSEAIQEIQKVEKPRKLVFWVSQFSERPKKIREQIAESLVSKNVLYQDDKHFFRHAAITEEEQISAPSKYEIKSILRAIILFTREADNRSIALLNLISACNLLNLVFTQDELAFAKRRISEELIRSALKEPQMQTIEEIGQAVAANLEDNGE